MERDPRDALLQSYIITYEYNNTTFPRVVNRGPDKIFYVEITSDHFLGQEQRSPLIVNSGKVPASHDQES